MNKQLYKLTLFVVLLSLLLAACQPAAGLPRNATGRSVGPVYSRWKSNDNQNIHDKISLIPCRASASS